MVSSVRLCRPLAPTPINKTSRDISTSFRLARLPEVAVSSRRMRLDKSPSPRLRDPKCDTDQSKKVEMDYPSRPLFSYKWDIGCAWLIIEQPQMCCKRADYCRGSRRRHYLWGPVRYFVS